MLCKRLSRSRIGYRDASPMFRGKITRQILKSIGINWFNAHGNDISSWTNAFELNHKATHKAADFIKGNNKTYGFLIRSLCLSDNMQEKLFSSIQREMLGNWLTGGTTSIALIVYLYKNKQVYVKYYPSSLEHVLLSHYCDDWINVCRLAAYINKVNEAIGFFTKIAINKIWKLFAKTEEKVKANDKPFDGKVAYFPHKGLKYGNNIFKKTCIYSGDANNSLYKKKILTLDLHEFDDVSKRYMRKHKIPSAQLKRAPSISCIFKSITDLKKSLFSDIRNGQIAECFMVLKFYLQMKSFEDQLKQYKNLKAAYFFYDILTPNSLLFSCSLLGIKTYTHQERSISSFWDMGMIFDTYFLSGPKYLNLIQSRSGVIGERYVIGLPRSEQLNAPARKIKTRNKNIDKLLSGEKKYILCLDLPESDSWFSSITHKITTWESLHDFYASLIYSAKEIKEYIFVVKAKEGGRNAFKIRSLFAGIENIIYIDDLSYYTVYELASMASVIIGKQTSLLEEAFSMSKPTIIYDNDDYLRSINHPLAMNEVLATNAASLLRLLELNISENYFSKTMEKERLRNDWFVPAEKGFSLIKDALIEGIK